MFASMQDGFNQSIKFLFDYLLDENNNMNSIKLGLFGKMIEADKDTLSEILESSILETEEHINKIFNNNKKKIKSLGLDIKDNFMKYQGNYSSALVFLDKIKYSDFLSLIFKGCKNLNHKDVEKLINLNLDNKSFEDVFISLNVREVFSKCFSDNFISYLKLIKENIEVSYNGFDEILNINYSRLSYDDLIKGSNTNIKEKIEKYRKTKLEGYEVEEYDFLDNNY